jgi:L-alanine-DL-glutamate epimerase-like enolase superfamily enzyme
MYRRGRLALRIRAVDVVRVSVPLSRPFVSARGAVGSFDNLLVRVHGDEGVVGLGEWARSHLQVGLDARQAERVLRDELAPKIVGLDSMDIEAIIARLDPAGQPSLEPIGAIDLALWDLNGKALGLPVSALLGGTYRELIPVDYTLSRDRPDLVAATARKMAETFGYTAFSVKAGGASAVGDDIDRIRLVREAVGRDARIRLDANGGYSADSAIHVLRGVERYGVELIEQPIPAGDIGGLERIAKAVGTPIGIDEGLVTLADGIRLAESGAVKVFNIKIMRSGGLLLSRKLAAVAEAAGLDCVCGGALALEVVRQASRHFATATNLGPANYAGEGPGPASQALTGNIATTVVGYADVARRNGHVVAGPGPGLGVTEDRAAVGRYLRPTSP